MNICPHCQGEFRLNVTVDRHTGVKYLRAGCCDSPLRKCPNPDELLRSPNITPSEREYLQRVLNLDWFGGAIASVLLQIEAKTKASEGVML